MELDPGSAEAAAGIGQLHLLEFTRGGDPAEGFARTEVWARRAAQLDPRSSQAWMLQSALETLGPEGDARKSLEYALKAASFDSRNRYALVALAESLAPVSFSLAAAAYLESPRWNPLDLISSAAAAGFVHLLGDTTESLSIVDRVLSIEPEFPYALLSKSMLLTAADRTEEAAVFLERAKELDAAGAFPAHAFSTAEDMFALVSHAGGHDVRADASRDRLVTLAMGEGDRFPFWTRLTQGVAPLIARHSGPEAALRILQARLALGVTEPYDYLLWNAGLQELSDQAAFRPILEASHSRLEETIDILRQAEQRGELPLFLAEALDSLEQRLSSHEISERIP